MGDDPRRIFYLPKLEFERQFGCNNINEFLESLNTSGAPIAGQIYEMFLTFCNRTMKLNQKKGRKLIEKILSFWKLKVKANSKKYVIKLIFYFINKTNLSFFHLFTYHF